ncbi:PH domain-containing protein [Amphibacillus indicireducens]|uniref:PH domain-containing protein n=1 Tax=Amphibacillus indicireducens TaxID=1076330 RepID=A0ABP7V1Z5_9BACI
MTSNPARLHPAAILLFSFKTVKDLFFLFLVLFFAGLEDGLLTYLLIGTAALISIIVFFSWIKWFRFTYSVNGSELRIEHGLFVRKKRTISKYRIQSINLNQNIVHRFLGLTGIQIETAGSDLDVDANLIALKLDIADKLRQELTVNLNEENDSEAYDYDYALEKKLPKYEASFKRLFAFGSTSGGFGFIVAIILFIFSEAEAFIPERLFDQTTSWILSQVFTVIAALIILSLGLIWFLGTIGSVIKYGDFTIIRYDHELYITRGLVEKKQLTIPLKRIQAVSFKQNPLRLPFRLGSLTIVIAGGEVSQKENIQTVIFPLIRRSEIETFLATILPEYTTNFDQLKPISRRYFYINTVVNLLIAVVIISILAIFISSFWWIGLVVLTLALGYDFIKYKLTKTALSEDQLTLQIVPVFSKETVWLKKDKIQALEQSQNPIQRKLNIATYKVSVLDNFVGQHYVIHGLPIEDANTISDWYSYRDTYQLKDIDLDK